MFYELLPRSFLDSNADGIGDFAGLTARLDYLEWLGVDCLWLLPFYPSPLRDGGYDVSDFMSVAPECGSIDDLAGLVQDALDRNAIVEDDSDVHVDASGNTVTLGGHVRTWAEHDAVVGATWMAPGVLQVRDYLDVTG